MSVIQLFTFRYITQFLKVTSLFVLLVLHCQHANATNNVSTTSSTTQKIMVLGDSLSASYGIRQEEGWVYLLKQYLHKSSKDGASNNGKQYQIINASISGETTGGALSRLPKLLELHSPHIVIVELGGNDGLRGYPINVLRNNLSQIISLCKATNAKVLIAGMRIPPNYGPRYTTMFYDSYALMAQKYNIPLVPFLLDEIAIYPELMQTDGIHPTAKAQPQILQNVLPHLKEIL